MTAKEIAEECYSSSMGMYVFDDEDLKEYANALCKEQREKCLEKYSRAYGAVNEANAIARAPQPEHL